MVSYSKWKGILKQFLYLALEKILNTLGKGRGSKTRVKSDIIRMQEKGHLKYLD